MIQDVRQPGRVSKLQQRQYCEKTKLCSNPCLGIIQLTCATFLDNSNEWFILESLKKIP
jgi:hypothetical protein